MAIEKCQVEEYRPAGEEGEPRYRVRYWTSEHRSAQKDGFLTRRAAERWASEVEVAEEFRTTRLVLPDGSELVYDALDIVPVGDRGIPGVVLYRNPGEKGRRPAYEVTIEIWDGVPEVLEVKVRGNREDRVRVNPKDIKIRGVDLDGSIAYWLSEVAYRRDPDGVHDWVKDVRVSATERRAAVKAVESARRRTHHKITNELLRRVAETYETAAAPKHVAVARAFGKDERTAQRWIAKAREAELLPPSQQGHHGQKEGTTP